MTAIESDPTSFHSLLTDGAVVQVRPIDASDADGLLRFHGRLSPETTYFRFFRPHPQLSPKEVAHFTRVDHADREALVALVGDEIIGVARYDRAPGTTEAEVAFVVDDAWQGHGVASLLLEHLADRARAEGIATFVAETLFQNRRMLGVFRHSGLSPTRSFDGDVMHVTMPLGDTDQQYDVIEAREHVSERASIARLLEPDSIAVIGASGRPGSVGGAVLRNLVDGNFEGTVYAVNARGGKIADQKAYRTVGDIPGPVDIAVIAVPAGNVVEVAHQCGAAGVHGLVVVSAGFAEIGEAGTARQQALVAAARQHGMRLIGPNCIGIGNTNRSMNATFADRFPPAGRIGLMSQSGAVGVALLDAAARTGLGISTFVSAGNKADVSGNDLLQYWEDDPATDVVTLYLESLGNPRKFARLAQRVARKKPIVVVKSGRTEAGRRAASSHTAAMAASDAAVDALFRQAGVSRVNTVREMFSVARILALQPLPEGKRVAIVGNSGGPGILAADACSTSGLELSELSPKTQDALGRLAAAGASTRNPVDLLASAGPAEYSGAIQLIVEDPAVDAIVVIFTPTLTANPRQVAEAIARAAAGSTKPVVASIITEVDGTVRDAGLERAVPRFEAPEDAVQALATVARRAEWLRQPVGSVPPLDHVETAVVAEQVGSILGESSGGRWLTDDECRSLLQAYGIPLVDARIASSPDEAVEAARAIGYPVAMKVASPALLHKSDAGGVAVGLANDDGVRGAWADMARRITGLQAVLVQAMADNGVETIVGGLQDPQFGPLVMFGIGGTTAELLGDNVMSLAPLTDVRAAEVVRSLRTSPLLFGYRGSPPVKVDALESVLLRVAKLVDDFPAIAELDLNPVIVTPSTAVAVDARIRVNPPPLAPPAGRRLRDVRW